MSGDEQGYNGWKNYETWAMALWINNEEWSYHEARQIVRDNMDHNDSPEQDPRVYPVADALKDWQEEMMPKLEASVWSDLLRVAFSEVDWFEIAGHYMAELVEVGE